MPIRRRRTNRTELITIDESAALELERTFKHGAWDTLIPGDVFVVQEWDDSWGVLKVTQTFRANRGVEVEYQDGQKMKMGLDGDGGLINIARKRFANHWHTPRGSCISNASPHNTSMRDILLVDGVPHRAVYEEYFIW